MRISRVTLLGHKDHGKSTLIGNLLIATNSTTQQRIDDAKRTSEKLKRVFEPGFILDSFSEEREGGLTIDTTRAQINYKDEAFEFIDVPGHEELIKNMISGASYANSAILVVSAKSGEGIKEQTKRHLLIAKLLGINKIAIVVNKMDLVEYKRQVFEGIKNELGRFLENVGFEKENLNFIPVSAYQNENLLTLSEKISWYTGPTLLEILYRLNHHEELDRAATSLRGTIQGELKQGKNQLLIGKIFSGRLTKNEVVVLSPQNIAYKALKVFVKGKEATVASAGENVAIEINKKIKGTSKGQILCDEKDVIIPQRRFNAVVFVGKKFSGKINLRFNGMETTAAMKIVGKIDLSSGDLVTAKSVNHLDIAKVEVQSSDKIPMEFNPHVDELSRFTFYKDNEFIGIGVLSND